MAESYSVKAILSATDRGFTSTLKNALHSVTGLAKSVGSGMLMGAGMAAFNALTNGARNLVGEINDSNVAWKTFGSNMSIIGMGATEIAGVKKELQDFAQETVYSASDMASTYAQLAAVGTKNTSKLVKGFGGLAAAAENPQQAMKTLSQQATQMAAKPTVQWADFKLMLEQTPAGMAAVAKSMGMTTAELVTAVQKGKVKTEDFFNTIAEVGGDANSEFYKMATEAKSVGQAMDGLKETVGNKLTPAFDVLSKIGIAAIEKIGNKIGKLDGDAIANTLSGWIKKAQPMWNSFQRAVSKVWGVVSGIGKKLAPVFETLRSKASRAIQGLLDKIGEIDVNAIIDKVCGWAQKAQPYFDLLVSAFQTVSAAISAAIPYVIDFASAIGGFLLDHAETICTVISKATPIVLGLIGAFKGYKIISSLVPGMTSFASSLASMASGGIKGLAGKLFGVAAGQTASGKAASTTSKQMLASAKAFMMIGTGVLMVAAAFALLAQSAIALSNAGGLAIGVMAGLVIAVAGLTLGMMAMMKTIAASPAKLTAMATAMLALGAAVLMIGAGFALMAQASIALANAGNLAIGVMVGMVAVVALLAVGAAALGTALTAGAVGFVAFGAAAVLVGAGALIAAAALQLVAAVLPTIASYGLSGALAITALGGAMIVFAAGAAAAGAACAVLGAGLIVAAAGALAMTVGVVALAAGTLALGAALIVCGASLMLVSAVLPATASGASAVAVAFVALVAVSVGLAASLVALSASLVALAASSVAGAAGIAAFGVAIAAAAVGTLAMMAALKSVKSSMKSIASSAKTASNSLKTMNKSIDAVENGLNALNSKANSAMKAVLSAFNKTAKDARNAGKKVGEGFTKGMQSGLNKAPSIASSAVSRVCSTLRSGYGGAYSAGAYISQGFAAGMRSCLAEIIAAANAMIAAAEKAIRAKAMIDSPSKLTTKLGAFFGEGFANGIDDMAGRVWDASRNLVAIPNVATPNLAMGYGGEMSADYEYFRSAEYIIQVPLFLDGREVGKATARYTQEEIDRQQTRDNRKRGKV